MEYVQGCRDTVIIPDKYNTGIEAGVELTDVSEGIKINEVNFGLHDAGYLFINYYANSSLPTESTVERQKFLLDVKTTNMPLYTEEKTIIFKNCEFTNGFQHDYHEISKVSIVFENCKFGATVSGSNMTFNKCSFSNAAGGDGLNPFCNVEVNDCYFYGFAQTNDSGTHTDGVQIAGSTHLAPKDINFNNVRFELPVLTVDGLTTYINAPIMVKLDYNDASDISFKNCIVNGGGYSIYANEMDYTLTNVFFENIQIGAGRKYGQFYPGDSDGVTTTNVIDTEKLYVSSVWKDDTGKVHIITTNDTAADRTLTVVTNKETTTHNIECKATAEANGATTTEEIPIDVEIILDNTDIDYVVCYDTEVSEENQIRFVEFSSAQGYGTVKDLFKDICDAIREKTQTSEPIKHTDIPEKIRLL